MTGYGTASLEAEGLRGTASVRGVNHRFLDLAIHLPRRLQALEPDIRERVARAVARGRLEVVVQMDEAEASSETVMASRPLVASLVGTLRKLREEFSLAGDVDVSDLARFPGALVRVDEPGELAAPLREAALSLVDRALEGLRSMRSGEGRRLQEELVKLLQAVQASADRIEERSAASREARSAALRTRVAELLGEAGLEEARLYQEVVRQVERHDVAEELQRLRSHLASMGELLAASAEPCGKRLDFLTQELMREANTVGSKIQDAAAIREVVELKAQVERIREQVQNVE